MNRWQLCSFFSCFLPFWELSCAERPKSEGVLCQVFRECRPESRNARKVFRTKELVDHLGESRPVSIAPPGLCLTGSDTQGLPWAAFLRRFAALVSAPAPFATGCQRSILWCSFSSSAQLSLLGETGPNLVGELDRYFYFTAGCQEGVAGAWLASDVIPLKAEANLVDRRPRYSTLSRWFN